ncbi:cyclase family protein [Amycolatopsis jejuensis]|uniref:cyclase family protein n=1 Tax=Amycolatopsis jejuensis TaxID=330084 RepID=UPI001FDFC347|nr:cyclase family protein [Amycolatopsis jejuensis]
MSELLAGTPTNWGRWGPGDEVGALNHLTAQRVLRGVAEVRDGRVFTLGTRIGSPEGDAVWPGRAQPQRYNTRDRSSYVAGKQESFAGGGEYADDMIVMNLQGATHTDALGHVWHDDTIYNGQSAGTTVDALGYASVLPLAERGIAGRGVLLDLARRAGVDALGPDDHFGLAELLDTAARQDVTIEPGDILLIRTGWLGTFRDGKFAGETTPYREPGLVFGRDLVEWFHATEIPALVTDTMANEATRQPDSDVVFPLHQSLMRNLGVTFHEIAALDELAADCAQDGRYRFLFVAAPLKVVGATGAPVNPVVLK